METPFLVTARKYRPQKFEDVLGQEHVTRTLQNALSRGKVAHAYLFSGPRGIGKTTSARLLAKALNCPNGEKNNPCNACPTCEAITSGRHVDVIEIDAASNRGIDNIRELRREVLIAPAEALFKIYIIDEVHMLSIDAFNALLKTLEEPPRHVKFILATTETHKIPATIASRCQRFSFRRVPIPVLVEGLRKILEKEAGDLIPEAIREEALYCVAKVGGGSVRDSESALDQLISFASKDVTLDEIRSMLGIVATDLVDLFVRAVHQGEIRNSLDVIAKALNEGVDAKQFLAEVVEYYRNLLVAKDVSDLRELVDLPLESVEQLKQTAQMIPRQDLLRAMEILWDSESRLRTSGEGRIALESAALKIAGLPKSVEINEVLDHLRRLSDQIRVGGATIPHASPAAAPRPTAPPRPAAPVMPPQQPEKPVYRQETPVESEQAPPPPKEIVSKPTTEPTPPPAPSESTEGAFEKIRLQWTNIVSDIRKTHPALGSCLSATEPLSLEGQALVLGIPAGFQFHASQISENANRTIVQSAIRIRTGTIVTISTTFSTEVRPKGAGETSAPELDSERQNTIGAKLEERPELREFVNRIDGKVIDLKPSPKTPRV